MNDTYVKSHWSELKGKVKARWNRLTEEDLNATGGQVDQVCAKIRERYGVTDADARRQFEQFTEGMDSDTKMGSQGQGRQDQGREAPGRSDQARPGQGRPDQGRPGQGRSEQARPN